VPGLIYNPVHQERIVQIRFFPSTIFLTLLVGINPSHAQPLIYARGIVNAASSLPSGIAAGGIARGSLFTIYGRNLGPATGISASTYPLQTTLSNVSITATNGPQTVNVLPVYVSAGQINAILPSNAPLGTLSLRVKVGTAQSNPLTMRAVASSLGIFTARGTGVGPGVLQNFVTQANQPVNAPQVAAKPGQVITLWGTGLGAVASDTVAPAAGDLPVTVEVFVGGKLAPKLYSGRAPCCAGTDQIVFQLAADTPTGCWVPVYVKTASTVVSNVVTMAITADGSPCREGLAATALMQGGKMGLLAPMRVDIRQSTVDGNLDMRTDFVIARLANEAAGPFPFNPMVSLPPAGSCSAYSGAGDWFTTVGLPDLRPGVAALNGGGFTVTGGSKSSSVLSVYSPMTLGILGASNPALAQARDTSLLGPGNFTLQTKGGSDVPAFSVPFTMLTPFTWSNRDQISILDRTKSFAVSWSGAAGLNMAVVGGSVDLPTNSSSLFVCSAAASATSITVPSDMLANLPPDRGSTRDSKAMLFLIGASPSSTFTAASLSSGILSPTYVAGKTVTVR
jgi:uncharacterized protein (TIGR03437 family)